MHKWMVGGILVLAFLLRTVGISSYPVGFTQDEASFGYDAYSLLTTGKDQWGANWPSTLRSFGDFKLPLYAYLAIPSVAIFGLNEFAVRLPNALLGTLAVLVTYLLVVEWLGKHGITQNEKQIDTEAVGLLAALLLAVSPWHISLSRGAFEANLTTFFLPLGVWAFLRGVKAPRWMVVAALAFGLNLFSYHSARLATPLLVVALVCWKRKELKNLGNQRFSIAVFAVSLAIASYTMFFGAGARGADIVIFNPTDRWAAVSERRYEAVLVGLPDQIARFFSNKAVYIFDQFVVNYLSYLSPQFLFSEGAGEWAYGMIPGRGVLYLLELPFIVSVLLFLAKRKTPELGLLLVWILLSLIPAALTKGPGLAANRVAIMMPAIQILSAYGGILLFDVLSKWASRRKLLLIYSSILLVSLISFLEDYIYHAPKNSAPHMLYGRKEAVEFVKSVETNYAEIVFSRSLSEPQIFVAFYNQWDPADYQKESKDWLRYKEQGLPFVDQLGEYRLGKYVFGDINFEGAKEKPGGLLVGKPFEFPQNVVALKAINYPDGKPAILVVDPTAQIYAKATQVFFK